MADNGAKFQVTVTNIKGKATSDPATLTVVPGRTHPPIITTIGDLA
jgi:hypothetical protein